MSYGPQASQSYLRNSVMTASQEQLHLMLLDGAIRFTSRAQEALEKADHEATFNALERAQRIVLELSNGLVRDRNPELVDRMIGLYAFVFRRLVDASIERSVTPIEEALRILRHQRETWAILMERVKLPTDGQRAEPEPAEASTNASESRFVAEA